MQIVEGKKKLLGQYFTNENIANFMVKWTINRSNGYFLDPSAGKGIFVSLVRKYSHSDKIVACDIDPDMQSSFITDINADVEFIVGNYLTVDFSRKFDAIVCNPPYNKFQKIPYRYEVRNLFLKKYGVRLHGNSNLCVYFLVKSIFELNVNGRCAYIMPYEFLNTVYGIEIKKILINSGYLSAIIKFDNTRKGVFDDAVTTTCILLLEGKRHSKVCFYNVNGIDDLNESLLNSYETCSEKKYSDLRADDKWINYFHQEKKEYSNLVNLSSVAVVKRGIATGSNKYFVLSQEDIMKHNISTSACLPCITKSMYVRGGIFTESDFLELVKKNIGVFLFNGENAQTFYDKKYIEYGERSKINKLYLTSHRTPWYRIENKEAAPIWLGVFSRGALKVIRNRTNVKTLTTFHNLYFLNDISEDMKDIYFAYFLTPIGQKILKINKREYGEGLDKFEPNDFNKAKILNMDVLTKKDRIEILSLVRTLDNSNTVDVVEKLDKIFFKYVFENLISAS